jgi:acetolactate synthase-1/2/3 large subunit
MLEVDTRGVEKYWGEYPAEEWTDAIVASMKLGGVDYLFFVSGTEMSFFQESTTKAAALGRPAPKLITMVHESVALHAAIGVTMVTGQPAASAVHVDVGTLHYGAAIHAAWRGGYPVLMMAGTAPRAFPGSMRGGRDSGIRFVQEPRDQGEIVRQYTKMDHRMEHQDNPGLMVSRLLQVAMSDPKGPVYLTVPRETAMLPMPGTTRFATRDQLGLSRPTYPTPEDAREIARWLVKAENPCIYTSHVGEDPQAVEELVRLAELLAIPVMETGTPSRLNFPRSHALYGTGPRPQDADVLLLFESWPPYLPGIASPSPDAKIAWISSDPVLSRMKTLEMRADLWISATAANVARAVYEAATGMLSQSDISRVAGRRERVEHQKREMLAREEEQAIEAMKAPTPTGRLVGYELGKLIDSDAIILNDGLSNGGFIDAYARRDRPGTYFRSGSSAGGWGVGAAFGAKLAAPDREVIHASGDGFFQFGTPMAGLWASKFHKAPYLTIVFVNGSYSTGTSGLRSAYPEGYSVQANDFNGGAFDPPPDFAKLAEAAGGFGEYVTETAQVGPALKRALSEVRKGSPALVAVRVPGPLQGVVGRGE